MSAIYQAPITIIIRLQDGDLQPRLKSRVLSPTRMSPCECPQAAPWPHEGITIIGNLKVVVIPFSDCSDSADHCYVPPHRRLSTSLPPLPPHALIWTMKHSEGGQSLANMYWAWHEAGYQWIEAGIGMVKQGIRQVEKIYGSAKSWRHVRSGEDGDGEADHAPWEFRWAHEGRVWSGDGSAPFHVPTCPWFISDSHDPDTLTSPTASSSSQDIVHDGWSTSDLTSPTDSEFSFFSCIEEPSGTDESGSDDCAVPVPESGFFSSTNETRHFRGDERVVASGTWRSGSTAFTPASQVLALVDETLEDWEIVQTKRTRRSRGKRGLRASSANPARSRGAELDLNLTIG